MFAIEKNGMRNPKLYTTREAAECDIQHLYGSMSFAKVVDITLPLSYFTDLVRSYHQHEWSKEVIGIVAALCKDAHDKGQNSGMWHNSARYWGYKCNCVPCNPTAPKGRFTYKSVAHR